jgi:hypothetical protein
MVTFEEFLEKYKPFTNFFSSDPEEIKFETYGEELDHVLIQNNKFIWTAVNSENENMYILPGKHFVNRSHYYVCANPWTNEEEIVNDNEMLSVEDSIKACLDFFETLDYSLNANNVKEYFENVFPEPTQEITLGDAKYTAIDYWGFVTHKELGNEEEDLIHNFYSNLI